MHPRWGVLSEPTPESLSRLSDPTSEHYNALKYTYYVQYHLHRQLLSVGVVPPDGWVNSGWRVGGEGRGGVGAEEKVGVQLGREEAVVGTGAFGWNDEGGG